MSFQNILWPCPPSALGLDKHKEFIIHRTLANSRDFEELHWLFTAYPKQTIIEVFRNKPQKIYTPSEFYFVKNYILKLINEQIKETTYIDTTIPTRTSFMQLKDKEFSFS